MLVVLVCRRLVAGGQGGGVGSKAGVELQEIGRSRWAPTIFG
jgi:hypothetical protein